MFNTIVHTTQNNDLAIANKRNYERKIDRLESDIHKGCTPEQLEKAEGIANGFREKLAFRYISAKNSLVNFVCWKTIECGRTDSLNISFELNCRKITLSVPDLDVIIKTKRGSEAVDGVAQAIATEIYKELIPVIIPEAFKGKD